MWTKKIYLLSANKKKFHISHESTVGAAAAAADIVVKKIPLRLLLLLMKNL